MHPYLKEHHFFSQRPIGLIDRSIDRLQCFKFPSLLLNLLPAVRGWATWTQGEPIKEMQF
jgi:hypothetical protein